MEIQTRYDADAGGWLSDPIRLDGDAWVEGELTEKGYLTIQKSEAPESGDNLNGEDFRWERALTSERAECFKIRIYGSVKYPWMRIATSKEPISFEYEKI